MHATSFGLGGGSHERDRRGIPRCMNVNVCSSLGGSTKNRDSSSSMTVRKSRYSEITPSGSVRISLASSRLVRKYSPTANVGTSPPWAAKPMLPLVASTGMFFVIDAGRVQALCEWGPPEGAAMGTVRYSYHPCC